MASFIRDAKEESIAEILEFLENVRTQIAAVEQIAQREVEALQALERESQPLIQDPGLSLEEKRQQIIGKAYINQDRCIAWSDHRDCIVCEEMCPVPDKAIQLEEAQVWGADNSSITVKLPHVVRERCIGCGICEYKCPVNGEAAIRVFVPETTVPF